MRRDDRGVTRDRANAVVVPTAAAAVKTGIFNFTILIMAT